MGHGFVADKETDVTPVDKKLNIVIERHFDRKIRTTNIFHKL